MKQEVELAGKGMVLDSPVEEISGYEQKNRLLKLCNDFVLSTSLLTQTCTIHVHSHTAN